MILAGTWGELSSGQKKLTHTHTDPGDDNTRRPILASGKNGLNPSSGPRDLFSAKSGPNLCQIWQVFCPWASPYGANGQMTMTVHNYRPRQFAELWTSGYRDMGPASVTATRTMTTIPLQPGGLRGKNASHVAEQNALENHNCMEAKCSPDTSDNFGDEWQPLTTINFVTFRCHWKIFNTAKFSRSSRGHVWFSTIRQKSNLCQ